ncbi:transmembrane amino acid transporter protein-domain-containing protein [Dactylonectria macrodidyma]|uniref:Transmembrane amino acid transporter protein-domain-containing protein n=1 Tax=Dactylonectria macrodidyma TaxID=307937 RepID=A0A9P9JIP6_9HYPO|nr:transmembrane amino acid transporter protein-domain-containing protein [Dactylonectria macrodidyma]
MAYASSSPAEKDMKRDLQQDPELNGGLGRVPSQQGEVDDTIAHDAVFGDITEDGPNYRNVGWIGTVALMMKTQVGLGVLSIPAVFDTLGIVPGVICLSTIAAITTWSDYIVGVFKLRHASVYGIDDAGALIFGRLGREILGIAFCLYWIFVAGSGMLGISIGLNAVSTHGACTAVFVAVAAIVGFGLASIRTLGRISWLAWLGLVCILTAIFTVTIAVGVQDRPSAAPHDGHWESDFKIVNNPSFTEAISAVSALVFAYAGTPAFFSIAAEMRDPHHYTRALIICQSGVTITYIVIGCVVYVYCGSYVASPALGSAGPTIKKISYGLALPGLIATTTLVIHFAAKYMFVRILRGSKHLTANTLVHWGTWLSCTFATAVIAYLIASGIPVFGGLVSLVGALFGTLMSFQPMGCMWLYDNWSKGRQDPTLRWYLMVAWSVFVIVSGTFLMIGGTYGSIVGIIDSYKESGGSAAWSCADNSNSV